MRRMTTILCAAIGIAAASITPATAQQKSYFKDGVINLDQKKYDTEFDQLGKQSPSATARSLRKHDYCVICLDGTKFDCKSLFGGETGRIFCTLRFHKLCFQGEVRVVEENKC